MQTKKRMKFDDVVAILAARLDKADLENLTAWEAAEAALENLIDLGLISQDALDLEPNTAA